MTSDPKLIHSLLKEGNLVQIAPKIQTLDIESEYSTDKLRLLVSVLKNSNVTALNINRYISRDNIDALVDILELPLKSLFVGMCELFPLPKAVLNGFIKNNTITTVSFLGDQSKEKDVTDDICQIITLNQTLTSISINGVSIDYKQLFSVFPHNKHLRSLSIQGKKKVTNGSKYQKIINRSLRE